MRFSKSTLFSVVMIFLVIPSVILAGYVFLDDRKYFFTSLVIIICAMLPFFYAFEQRAPKAREMVVISTLCAIAVAGRAVFYMLPQFKPMAAIIIISGICFGTQSGFLVGAVSAFVSNFFFGQGPWTPWQMFAFGTIGFLAGVLFQNGFIKRDKIVISIFGALSVFIIYGGVMNTATVLMFQAKVTFGTIIAGFVSGFNFDLIHTLSTVIFLFLISKPMIEKLSRIKTKYGLI